MNGSRLPFYHAHGGFRSLFQTLDLFPLIPVLAFSLLLASLAPSARVAHAATGLYEVREIKPRVFVWIPDDVLDQEGDPEFPRACNAGFILTSEAVVVVDTTNSPFHGRDLLYEIRRRTEAPIQYVIDTSAAGDHMLGNEVFVDQRSTLISSSLAQVRVRQYQQELARRMDEEGAWRLQNRMRGFHVTPATQTFEGSMVLQPGGQDIKMNSLLNNGDATVYLPGPKVLFLGPTYENDFFPRIGTRDVHRWVSTLRQVEAWDVDVYVPGHGAPSGKKELAAFRQFLEWLEKEVETRVQQRKSLAEVKHELDPTEKYSWHAPEQAAEDVEDIYKQLSEAQPARADAPATQSYPAPH
jgi:glyoxylase-like metal-dependent hydrolase (beta-lactamase superfamily II)